jgi:hypothetical protein
LFWGKLWLPYNFFFCCECPRLVRINNIYLYKDIILNWCLWSNLIRLIFFCFWNFLKITQYFWKFNELFCFIIDYFILNIFLNLFFYLLFEVKQSIFTYFYFWLFNRWFFSAMVAFLFFLFKLNLILTKYTYFWDILFWYFFFVFFLWYFSLISYC